MKENKKQNYWFVRREYGWGWTPRTWQAWATLFIWLISLIFILLSIDKNSHSVSDTFYEAIIPLIIVTLIMWIICWIKGESPKWQWRNK